MRGWAGGERKAVSFGAGRILIVYDSLLTLVSEQMVQIMEYERTGKKE